MRSFIDYKFITGRKAKSLQGEHHEKISCIILRYIYSGFSSSCRGRFAAGDVVRIEKGEVHGLYNDCEECFEYVSVTTPPIDFGYAYEDRNK